MALVCSRLYILQRRRRQRATTTTRADDEDDVGVCVRVYWRMKLMDTVGTFGGIVDAAAHVSIRDANDMRHARKP